MTSLYHELRGVIELAAALEKIRPADKPEILPVRDGEVTRDMTIFYRSPTGPQVIFASHHWHAIEKSPEDYSIGVPKVAAILYED